VCWMDVDTCVDMVKNNSQPHCIWLGELNMISPYINVC
jgi:hypothetical protein